MHLRLQDWTTLVASSAGMALAVLVLWRGRRSALAIPLALLSIDFCVFNLATMFYELSGRVGFNVADKATSPLAVAFGLHFVLAFVGRKVSLRPVLLASYGVGALIALTSPLSLVFAWAARFIDPRAGDGGRSSWALANMLHLLAALAVGVPLLVGHYRDARGLEERSRARVVAIAIIVLAVGAGSQLLPNVQGAGAAPIAQTLFTLLLSAVTLRLGLYDVRMPTLFLPAAVLTSLVAAAVGISLFGGWNTTAAVSLLIFMFVVLVALTVAVGVFASRAVAAERFERMALMGRFSAQLAHNLKNPLAALKGAAQFLKVELSQGRSISQQQEFVELLLEQIHRLEGALVDYERLGKAEAVVVPLQVNDVVKSVLALQPFVEPAKVRIRADLDETLPTCRADAQLLGQAVENLVRNAFEAMPDGGEVTVSTRRGLGEVTVAVSDTGCGMDARTQELALKEFYTTKPSGSGLGLAFVRRVAEAHRGRLGIISREAEGTTVRLSLPV
jgi:two-component system, NtrC family, sensor histidine kinase HydH